MSPQDFVPFMDLFRGIDSADEILLILQTFGGDPNVASKMVNTIRDGRDKFRVIVPERAKSAGTLLALGADSILMGKSSELGPIDPQIPLNTRDGIVYRPAHSILDGFDDISQRCKKDPSTALLVLAQSIDIAVLDFAVKTIKHAETEACKLLETYMFKGNPNARELAKKISQTLADVNKYPSHGYSINRSEAVEMGLKIERLSDNNTLWTKVWSYYCRAFVALSTSNCQTLYESPRVSIML
jgi:hypothetical protein